MGKLTATIEQVAAKAVDQALDVIERELKDDYEARKAAVDVVAETLHRKLLLRTQGFNQPKR